MDTRELDNLDAEIERLRAALRPIPIADLPKDIDRALVWGKHSLEQEFHERGWDREWHTADWYGEEFGNFWSPGEGYINGVTHWMPLPDPPGD